MEQKMVFDKERSVTGHIVGAWKYFSLEWKHFFKAFWVYLSLIGVSGAFLTETIVAYACRQVLPALRLTEVNADPEAVRTVATPDLYTTVVIVAALLIFITACYCYAGRLVEAFHFSQKRNRLPHLRIAMSAAARRNALRLLRIDLPMFAVAAAATLLVCAAALKWNVWAAAALPLFYVIWGAVWNVARLSYALQGRNLTQALASGVRNGFGAPFIIAFIMLLLTLPFAMASGLPVCIYGLTEWANHNAVIMGDTAGMPGYVTGLYFVINALSISLCAFILTLCTAPVALKAGTLRKDRTKRNAQ